MTSKTNTPARVQVVVVVVCVCPACIDDIYTLAE
mgnify:CR=1 FL=1